MEGQSHKDIMHEKEMAWIKLAIIPVFLVILISFLLQSLYSITDEVKRVNIEKSVVEYTHSLSAVRAKWMMNRQAVSVRLEKVSDSELKIDSSLVFLVNKNGWPIGVENTSKSACEALWQAMQSVELNTVQVENISPHLRIIGCRYSFDGKVLFNYLFEKGKIEQPG